MPHTELGQGLGLPKRVKSRDPLLPIIFSLVVCSILVVYPLPYAVALWRPPFFLLVTLFWVLCQPVWCGVWFAFFTGLMSDLLLDGMLGQHAMSFVIVAFLGRYFSRNQRVLTFSNLWIIIALAVFLHLLIQFIFQKMADIQFPVTRHWTPWISSMLAWPVIYGLLKRWRM